jgi:hypothetical protein
MTTTSIQNERRFAMRASRAFTWVLAIALMTATLAASGQGAALRDVSTFASISDPVERSRALFVEVGKVIESPRCMNCHPKGDRPSQGVDLHPHIPIVTRGTDDKGTVVLRCQTCHQSANYAPSGVPGHPAWAVAPLAMAWQGHSLAQICEQIKDKQRNGGKSLAQLHEHMAHDSLVGWAWDPGPERSPAPGSQKELGALVDAWIASGAHCPSP